MPISPLAGEMSGRTEGVAPHPIPGPPAPARPPHQYPRARQRRGFGQVGRGAPPARDGNGKGKAPVARPVRRFLLASLIGRTETGSSRHLVRRKGRGFERRPRRRVLQDGGLPPAAIAFLWPCGLPGRIHAAHRSILSRTRDGRACVPPLRLAPAPPRRHACRCIRWRSEDDDSGADGVGKRGENRREADAAALEPSTKGRLDTPLASPMGLT